MGTSPHVWFLHEKQRLLAPNSKLYGSQISRVVLCLQSSVISPRTTCLYGSQPFSVAFACKTASFGAELQVCMGPRPHLWFLHTKQRLLDQSNKSLWVPDMTCRFVHAQQLGLTSGLLVSMGPSPHLWLLHAKQRLLDLNYKSLWVQDITCGFVHANSAFSTWITSLYCSQPLSAVFACKTATFGAELQVWMGPRPHLSFCACKTAWLAPELQVSMGPRPHLWFWAHITACLAQD